MTERAIRLLEAASVLLVTVFIADAWAGGAGRRWLERFVDGYRSAGEVSPTTPAEHHPGPGEVAGVMESARRITREGA